MLYCNCQDREPFANQEHLLRIFDLSQTTLQETTFEVVCGFGETASLPLLMFAVCNFGTGKGLGPSDKASSHYNRNWGM
jgi:hypothetical protein